MCQPYSHIQLLGTHGLYPTRLLCAWHSPGQNTEMGSHSLIQGVFLTQGSNPGPPHCRRILYRLNRLVFHCKVLVAQSSGFPGSSVGKEFACNMNSQGDLGSILGLGRSPGGGHGNLLQYSCLENPHEQRSLVGYGRWGHPEPDTTK